MEERRVGIAEGGGEGGGALFVRRATRGRRTTTRATEMSPRRARAECGRMFPARARHGTGGMPRWAWLGLAWLAGSEGDSDSDSGDGDGDGDDARWSGRAAWVALDGAVARRRTVTGPQMQDEDAAGGGKGVGAGRRVEDGVDLERGRTPIIYQRAFCLPTSLPTYLSTCLPCLRSCPCGQILILLCERTHSGEGGGVQLVRAERGKKALGGGVGRSKACWRSRWQWRTLSIRDGQA